MRHAIAGNKLNRKTSHRKATVRDLAKATLLHQRIKTTTAKAKEARKLVDKLITLGKKGTLADRRNAFAILCDHKLVSELFKNIAGRFQERNGGYTRIILLGNRRGDNAEMALLELTERVVVEKKTSVKKSAAKKKSEVEDAEVVAETKPGIKEKVKDLKTKKDTGKKADQGKSGKNIVGGIKNIFKRKTGGDSGK